MQVLLRASFLQAALPLERSTGLGYSVVQILCIGPSASKVTMCCAGVAITLAK